MSGAPSGFGFQTRKGGEVVITHHGQHATTLRGRKAAEFLADMDGTGRAVGQEIMARLTGNYRRGNERQARQHPRNA